MDVANGGWFFRSHPLSRLARLGALSQSASVEFIYRGLWKSMNFVSQYASTNLHEWFADNFAAGILNRLGDQGALGDGWKDRLARLPEHSGGYWVNYNNLSSDMRTWLEARFVQEGGQQRPSGIYKK